MSLKNAVNIASLKTVAPLLPSSSEKEREGRKDHDQQEKISIIVSGMPSVGKTTVARAIAEKFELRLVGGGDMLKEMALEKGYKPSGSDWWDTPEGMRFLAERNSNKEFDKEVDRRLIEYVKRGRVVITSYTLPWICSDGLKIWLKASLKTRAKRLASRDSISLDEALEIVKTRDEENRLLYRSLYGIDFGNDLSVFNYVIDTENESAHKVSSEAISLVRNYIEKIGNRRSSE